MRSAVVACPAKVNTFLSVGRPDDTGYHPIRTVFRAVSLCDRLHISVGEGRDEITCDWAEWPAENTLTKALRFARELLPIPPLRIHVEKFIPAESGLGGGSSDAGGLIRWLAREFGSVFPSHTQAEVASAVGADVPFVASGLAAAKGEGYGERLTRITAEPRTLILARPEAGQPTANAYARLDQESFAWRDFPADLWEAYNDFERVAPCASLELLERMVRLGAASVGLTGSGSAVWGAIADAEKAVDELRNEGYWATSVRTLTEEDPLWTF